ncbi:MAG: hypothetical protein RR514_06715 [Christensenella sp.]
MYSYPDNLKAKATLFLWELRDIVIIGVCVLLSVCCAVRLPEANTLQRLAFLPPIVLTAVYAFLTIQFEGTSIMDFIRYAVSFFFLKQQQYEWSEQQ